MITATPTHATTMQFMLASNYQYLSDEQLKLATAKRISKNEQDVVSKILGDMLEGEIATISQARHNVEDLYTASEQADSVIDQSSELLMRAKELAIRSTSVAYSGEEQAMIENTYDSIVDLVHEMQTGDQFSGNVSMGTSVSVVAGTNGAVQTMHLSDISEEIEQLQEIDFDNKQEVLASTDDVLNLLIRQQSEVAAAASQAQSTQEYLSLKEIGVASARSRLVDADYARISTNVQAGAMKADAASAALASHHATHKSMIDALL